MIKAEELRIGNWVKDKYRNFRISLIDYKNGNYYIGWNDIEVWNINLISPISLTPEILTEWCGFKKIKTGYDNYYYNNELLELQYMVNEFIRVDVTVHCTYAYNVSFKYLHQIQNLFYAMHLHELEIKIPSLSTSHIS